MTHNKTMELTRCEIGVLRSAAKREFDFYKKVVSDGEDWGWHDAKEKERVLVHMHEAQKLFEKLNLIVKEMDNG